MEITSIEIVTDGGRKARINVSGHWGGLNATVATYIVNALTQGDQAPYGLSDFEEWEDEAQ